MSQRAGEDQEAAGRERDGVGLSRHDLGDRGASVAEDRFPATAAGTVAVGDLRVARLGFGAMRITGVGI